MIVGVAPERHNKWAHHAGFKRGRMPTDPIRENEVRQQIERVFADIEIASRDADIGIMDVLQLYGSLEDTLRRAQLYLSLLTPVSGSFSTSSNSNTPR